MHFIPVWYSSKPASDTPVSVPVVFQYCRSILNSSIPSTVSSLVLFLFQFLYWRVFYFSNLVPLLTHVLCTPTVKFPIFTLSVYILLLSKFVSLQSIIPVFVPSFVFLLFYSRFPFSCDVFGFFSLFCSRWDSEPLDRLTAFRLLHFPLGANFYYCSQSSNR